MTGLLRFWRWPWLHLLMALVVAGAVYTAVTQRQVLGYGAGPQWGYAAKHRHTQIASEKSRDELPQLAAWLDHYRSQTFATLNGASSTVTWSSEPPLSVRLLANRRSFQRFGRHFIRPRMDFCYSPLDRTVYGYWMSPNDLQPRLRHEMMHALLHWSGRDQMPLWLEEGICELFEYVRIDPNDPIQLTVTHVQGPRMLAAARAFREASPEALLKDARDRDFAGPERDFLYNAGYAVALWLYRQGRLDEAWQAGGTLHLDPKALTRFVLDPGAWSQPTRPSVEAERSWEVSLGAIQGPRVAKLEQ
jgi:hypothetical protein